jgi:FAD-dependent oxidoreductase domain-containing protein 1
MLIDSSGTYARREGSAGHFLCGLSPNDDEEPSVENLDVDYNFFDTHVWPNLAHRVPSMENLKVGSIIYRIYIDKINM